MAARIRYVLGLALLVGSPIASRGAEIPAAAPAGAASAARATTKWQHTAAPTHRLVAKGVPNFGKLNDNIWRSGQPTPYGYRVLAGQGLKTVVNLRNEYPQDKDMVPPGVKYVFIPIADEHTPTPAQAKQFLKIASDPANWPLLVHCQGGEGRAGVMSALLRRSLDGWDGPKALKEAANFRIRYLGLFTMPMPTVQKRFVEDWSAGPVQLGLALPRPAG